MSPRLLAFLVSTMLLFARAGAQAAGEVSETEAEQKLEQVRAHIRELTLALRSTEGERNQATDALRKHELAIAAAAADVQAIDEQLESRTSELDTLGKQRDLLAEKLGKQREALAVLLRSAYALGRSEELKLLLQQEDVGTVARVLAYHRYFQRARVDRIDGLLIDLKQLADLQQRIEDKRVELTATRSQREVEVASLQAERGERAKLLASIDASLDDQKARLTLMAKDENGLLKLLETLRDVFADIPKTLTGAEPFASLRGRLTSPASGKILTGFGGRDASGRQLSGVLIGSPNGSEVRAIARGRVAFADWLKGYGMLLILDHGDGYMSLYGYNESLRKEVGDWVSAGETIATSGSSGGQKGAALYFELRLKGKPINPKTWLR